MHDVQNQHHIVLRDTVKDDLIASGEAAHTRTQIATPVVPCMDTGPTAKSAR